MLCTSWRRGSLRWGRANAIFEMLSSGACVTSKFFMATASGARCSAETSYRQLHPFAELALRTPPEPAAGGAVAPTALIAFTD